MGQYGAEFGNAFADPQIGRVAGTDPVTDAFTRYYLSAGVTPFTMYLSRRDYLLLSPEPIHIPVNITLKFAAGGRIVLAPGTVLVIEGAIDAEPFQIFELRGTDASRAVVRIEGRLMERVYPEWWGAVSLRNASESEIAPGTGRDARLALQDCFRTASVERAATKPPLPPLTVVCSRYATAASIRVDADDPAHLWLDGASDPMGAPGSTPTLLHDPVTRVARGPDEATLALGPMVSAEFKNVGFKYLNRWGSGTERAEEPAGALLVRTDSNSPAWKGVRLSRCGLQGGRDYGVCIREESVPLDERGPRVAPSRRYRFGQCYFWIRYAERRASSRFALDASISLGGLVDLATCFLREDTLDREQPSAPLDYHAGVRLQGGAALVRACTFHADIGPRPSTSDPTAGPDGQDIWIDDNRPGPRTHLTALHIESQSWWFLGAARLKPAPVAGNVVLLNVGAENVNWQRYFASVEKPHRTLVRDVQNTGRDASRTGGDNATSHPPSVMWSGGPNRLVLVGCRLFRYLTAPQGTPLWDLGTVFKMPGSTSPVGRNARLRWLTPDHIPKPPTWVSPMPAVPTSGMWNGIDGTPVVLGLHLMTRGI